MAVAPYPDGKGQRVYVCHSPHIYVFEDKDGDLKADGPPKILLTGFKGYDHDHGVHGIHFGPDGKLYFSVGDQGVEKLSSANGNFKEDKETRGQGDKEKKNPGEPGALAPGGGDKGARRQVDKERVWTTNRTDCQAGTVWRCNPDGTNLELLAHNFRNPYEPAVDSFGTLFMSDNDDDGNQQTRICYVMYGGNYGYWPRNKGDHHWHEDQPGVVHKVLRTGFGSPTGMCWYEGALLREAFARQAPRLQSGGLYGYLLHTDAGPREVRCFVVKPKGAGYELDQINLVTSTDNWFRPSDVCVAPDGSVFVSDWYDPGVGGHGMGDTTRGRIYRITPKGHKGYKVPAVEVKSDDGIIQALGSPNSATRHAAVQAIAAKNPDQTRALFSASSPSLYPRFVWLLLQKFSFDVFDAMGQDMFVTDRIPNEGRGGSFQALFMRNLKDKLGDLTTRPEASHAKIEGVSIELRREILLGLRDAPPETLRQIFYKLAKLYDGQDPFYLAAINIAVGTDPKRREIILADFEKHFPEWNDKVAKLVWELRPPQVIAKLDQKLADPKLTAEQKKQILEILAFAEGDSAGRAFLKMLAAKETSPEEMNLATKAIAKHLPSRWAGLKKSPEMHAAVSRLFASRKTTPFAIELVRAGELGDYLNRLLDVAVSSDHPVENQRAAVRAFGAFKTPEALAALRALWETNKLNLEVIDALGRMGTAEAVAMLGKIALNGAQTPDLNDAAVSALAGSRNGTQWLLETHVQKKLPESLVATVARLLRNSPYQDLRAKALTMFPAPPKLDIKKLPPIAALVKRRGDPKQGEQLFRTNKDLGCIRCHSVRGVGGQIGPDLSMIGKKGSRENLFESLLDPDKAVPDQFVQWIILDDKGVTLTGLIVEDKPNFVSIRDANGKDTKIPKIEIERIGKSLRSIMPSDLLAYLSEDDLVDLVAYMETLRTPALTPESWQVLGPFANGENDAGLDKEYIPEPASRGRQLPVVDLNASHQGKHGRVYWRTLKPNAESYVDLAAYFVPNSSQIVSYLYREIESPAEQEATILLGADDGCKLWVNGEQVLSHRRHEAATPERDTVKVKLAQGKNTILLKINNGDGPHGFYFTVLSEQELKAGK